MGQQQSAIWILHRITVRSSIDRIHNRGTEKDQNIASQVFPRFLSIKLCHSNQLHIQFVRNSYSEKQPISLLFLENQLLLAWHNDQSQYLCSNRYYEA